MIPRVCGTVGRVTRFKGKAYDFDGAIAALEFSLDDGETWTSYPTPGTNDYQTVSWVFDYVPKQAGFYFLKVRSVNSQGKKSPEADFVEFLVNENELKTEVA